MKKRSDNLTKVISKDIKACPYCGSEEYVIKQQYSGTCHYGLRFDGEEADNGEMWNAAQWVNISKYAWCRQCGKRLFKLD
jgi:ribosomal protein L37E